MIPRIRKIEGWKTIWKGKYSIAFKKNSLPVYEINVIYIEKSGNYLVRLFVIEPMFKLLKSFSTTKKSLEKRVRLLMQKVNNGEVSVYD